MNLLTSRNCALLFGAVFVAVGVLGFIPNPLVSEHGLFMVNPAHNLVHILTGAFMLSAPLALKGKESLFLKIGGGLYLLVAILGFLIKGDMLVGVIMLSDTDRYLHVLLAAALLGAGFFARDAT
ncbi:MAG: DUF4383 domain-containing protein [Proteobacteria bacterium]|nr:DUF4383 domain-containing protein [Pseudomonadota bacterium]